MKLPSVFQRLAVYCINEQLDVQLCNDDDQAYTVVTVEGVGLQQTIRSLR